MAVIARHCSICKAILRCFTVSGQKPVWLCGTCDAPAVKFIREGRQHTDGR